MDVRNICNFVAKIMKSGPIVCQLYERRNKEINNLGDEFYRVSTP